MIYELFVDQCSETTLEGRQIFNHMYAEPYENAQELLIKEGLITEDQCEYS